MIKKSIQIGMIGHVDHGSTTLTSAISAVLSANTLKSASTEEDVPREERSFESTDMDFKLDNVIHLDDSIYKSGQELRRERRRQNRKK